MDLKNVQIDQLTPAETAQHVADMHVAIQDAQAEYVRSAREVFRAKEAWDRAKVRWILDDECPMPNSREGVARRTAWIQNQAEREWWAYELAKNIREIAHSELTTLRVLMSGAQTLDGSVRAQMGGTSRNPAWGA